MCVSECMCVHACDIHASVCMRVCVCAHACVCCWRTEDTLLGSVLSFYPVGIQDGSRVDRLACEPLCPLNHLTGPPQSVLTHVW